MASAADLTRLKNSPTAGELASRASDPRFYAALQILPNPDPILRRLGRGEEIHDAIESDAHVMGELRMVRGDLLRFEHRLQPGGESRKDKRAFELCQQLLARAPAPNTTWNDVIWAMGRAPFRGYAVQEVVWEKTGDVLMPSRILTRPQRRFGFDPDGALRLMTRSAPIFGVPAEEMYFLLVRHMPDYDNPYGRALLSSCYWPYLFKHGGFRWFVKFCERFGIPFPIGKYPAGTPEPQVDALEQALASIIEAGYAAIEDGSGIELLEAKGSSGGGKLAQHQLIETCNAEMSKALTSQTLSSEQTGSGSRAASETHRGRTLDVMAGDREQIAYSLDALWALITRINLGEDAKPPTSEFMADEEVSKDRAEIYKVFADLGGKPSRKAMAEELGITLANPEDAEDAMQAAVPKPAVPGAEQTTAAEFAASLREAFPDQAALDAVDLDAQLQPLIEQLLAPVMEAVKDGLPPEALQAQLAELYPNLDDAALQGLLSRAIFVGMVWGRLNAADPAMQGA